MDQCILKVKTKVSKEYLTLFKCDNIFVKYVTSIINLLFNNYLLTIVLYHLPTAE